MRVVGILAALAGLLLAGCGSGDEPASAAPTDTAAPAAATPAPATPMPSVRAGFNRPWTGDLDGMAERRVVRVLTVYGAGRYYFDAAAEKGMVAEMMSLFEEFLNQRLATGERRLRVVMVPVARDQLLPALLRGRGDLVVAGLTITRERQQQVAFSEPSSKPLAEILVTGPTAPELAGIEDLSGRTVHVRHSSSYRESLEALNARFAARGLAPVDIQPMSEVLEDDDLIEMVNGGLLPWAIVDNYKTQLWEGVFEHLTVRDDIVFREGDTLGWAMRPGSPLLQDAANDFLRDHREGTLVGNVLRNRYVRDFNWAAHALDDPDYRRFTELAGYFETYGRQYGIEHLLAAAQGYQESGLDQSKRSSAGAVGVMQLLPATAADPNVGIPDIGNAENNIHAGIKYLSFLRERYFSDPAIDRLNQTLLALAAYNAGPARIRRLREQAATEDYDPNIWFDNVEIIAGREIGQETVQYVANIYKYYLSYRLVDYYESLRREAREAAGID